MPYTKLDAGLIYSTVWREPHATVKVWITMLAMADKHGEVMASVPGLMDVAKVTREECDAALACFLSPDPDSRTPDYDGRRVEKIEGGWCLLNHAHYRKKGDSDDRKAKAAARAKRYRDRNKAHLQGSFDGLLHKEATQESPERHANRHAPSRTVTESHDKQLSSKQSPDAEVNSKSNNGAVHANVNARFIDQWTVRFGKGTGTAVAARLGNALKRLRKHHTDDAIFDQWVKYLREVPTRIASPQHFEPKCGSWTGQNNGKAGRLDSAADAMQRIREKHGIG